MALNGLVVVDKPPGCTSHDVVARCRRLLSERRIGHGGTLDPDATGVLLVGVGRVTRLLRFLTALPKTYRGQLQLGATTDTLDASGRETARWEMDPTPEEVRAAATVLTGRQMQRPPMVSAVQVGGRRLHELARQGIEVERQARPVTVSRFEVSPAESRDRYDFEVTCSSGTYVRVLVDDLGRALGGGAHLRTLRRTAVGPFTVDAAVALEEVQPSVLLSPAEAVGFLPKLTLDAGALADARHGRPIPAGDLTAGGSGPWAALDPAGELVGVYELGPDRVLRASVIVQPADAGA